MISPRHGGAGSQTINWFTDNPMEIDIPTVDSNHQQPPVKVDGALVNLRPDSQHSAFIGPMIELKATGSFTKALPDVAGAAANSNRNLFMVAKISGDGNCYMNAVLTSVILSNANNKQEIIEFLDGLKIDLRAEQRQLREDRLNELLQVQTSEPDREGKPLSYHELVVKFNQKINAFSQQIVDSPTVNAQNPNAIHPQALYDIINQRGQYATQDDAGNQPPYSKEKGLSKIASLFAKISAHQIEKEAGGWYEMNRETLSNIDNVDNGDVTPEFVEDIRKMKSGEFNDLGDVAKSFFSNTIEKKTGYKIEVLRDSHRAAQLNVQQIANPKVVYILHDSNHYTAAIKKNSGIYGFLPSEITNGIAADSDSVASLDEFDDQTSSAAAARKRRRSLDSNFGDGESPLGLQPSGPSNSGGNAGKDGGPQNGDNLSTVNNPGSSLHEDLSNIKTGSADGQGKTNQAPESFLKKLAVAATQSSSGIVKGLLQGIVHFPKTEENGRHKEFLGKLERTLHSHPNLRDNGIDDLFNTLKTHIAEETKDDPSKGQAMLQKFEEIKRRIEEEEEKRQKELKEATSGLVQQSDQIAKQDIDGQNSMWKWRLAQIILLTCGICGVDVLEPVLDLLGHIFSPDAASFGQGASEGMSGKFPGAGHVAGGITIASDYVPILGDFNNVVFALGSSELGQAAGGILGPLAHTQLASILFAGGFLANGIFNHELPHGKAIREARDALKEKIRRDPFAELDEKALKAYKSACDEFARKLIFDVKKAEISSNLATDHVVKMMNQDQDLQENLHIFEGIEFVVGGKKFKIENLNEDLKRKLLTSIKETDDLKKFLPRDDGSLSEIMKRLALHNELKSGAIADLSSERERYKADDSEQKKQVFSEVLEGLRANQQKYGELSKKLGEEVARQKVAIDKRVISSLQRECGILDSEKDKWIREENERRAQPQSGNAVAMTEQQELKFVKEKLEEKYVQKIASGLAKSRELGATSDSGHWRELPSSNPRPPITAQAVADGRGRGR